MCSFSRILSGLYGVIAARAARDRTLTVLLVALCGRLARMGTRLERLIALWRAGKLPRQRTPRAADARVRAPRNVADITFPTAPGWLRRKLGYEVGAFGSQLQHLLTEAECVEFLAAFPQAGRILRPLLGMLTPDPLPEVIRWVKRIAPVALVLADPAGVLVAPASQFFDG